MSTAAFVVAGNLWFEVIANVAVQGMYYGWATCYNQYC